MSFEARQAILSSLNEVFAPLDAEVLEKSKLWAMNRRKAINEWMSSDEWKSLRGNPWAQYNKLFDIAGGKTWFKILHGTSEASVMEFVEKNHAATIAKRNALITRKLDQAGVTAVESTTYGRTNDGFDGTFVVLTDAGKQVVTVNTIRAGGYNIQCLHLRVLVKVRKAK